MSYSVKSAVLRAAATTVFVTAFARGSTSITCGIPVAGSIDPSGEVDVDTIAGQVGQAISVSFAWLSGSPNHYMALQRHTER